MHFLSKEIEALVKRKKSNSLLKKQISCGIFQNLEADKLRAITKKRLSERLFPKKGFINSRN